METNMNPEANEELFKTGQELIAAAYVFSKAHQKYCGDRPVVWLKTTGGDLILYTRSEYLDQIMRNIQQLTEEIPLHDPFVTKREKTIVVKVVKGEDSEKTA